MILGCKIKRYYIEICQRTNRDLFVGTCQSFCFWNKITKGCYSPFIGWVRT
jgi:hypothetical protein